MFQHPDHSDKKRLQTSVSLASFALDKKAIVSDSDRTGRIRSPLQTEEKTNLLELTLDDRNQVESVVVMGRDIDSLSVTGHTGVLTVVAADGSHLRAVYAFHDRRPNGLDCHASFDLGMESQARAEPGLAIAPGKALSDPQSGAAYQVYFGAFQKGNVDAIIASSADSWKAVLERFRSDPDFPDMLKLMQMGLPASIKLTGGQDFGERVQLELDTVGSAGSPGKLAVSMVKQHGAWKYEGEGYP
jgi:hypothetical protein